MHVIPSIQYILSFKGILNKKKYYTKNSIDVLRYNKNYSNILKKYYEFIL